MSKAYVLEALVVGSTTVNEIVSNNLDPKLVNIVEGGDGKVDAEFTAIMDGGPVIEFSTHAVVTALAAMGISGLNCTGTDKVLYYLKQVAAGGTRTSGTTHIKITASEILTVPKEFEASQSQKAKISYEGTCASTDGATSPLALSIASALPTPVAAAEFFTLGPVYYEGSAISCVQSVKITFGLEIKIVRGDGGVWPKIVYIGKRRPQISVRTYDVSILNTIGKEGAAISTASKFYFQKMLAGGTRVPGATTSHLKFTVTQGMWKPGPISADDDSEAGEEFICQPTFDDTNDVMAIATGVAIGS